MSNMKYISVMKVYIGLVVVALVLFTGVTKVQASQNPFCADSSGVMTYYEFMNAVGNGVITLSLTADSNTQIATSTIVNNTGCTYPSSLSSYKMFDRTLSGQQYFSGTTAQIYDVKSVQVIPLPDCMTQIDLWYGQAPIELLDTNPYYTNMGPSVMTWTYTHNTGGWMYAEGKFCTNEDISAPAKIIVDKAVVPGSSTTTAFVVEISGSGSIIGSAVGDVTDAYNTEFFVSGGVYSVTEILPEGWIQVSNTCTNITVSEGEIVTCTITNKEEVDNVLVNWCSPGYWKQKKHFNNWVGYSPNQQFSSVFENAFPGKTLLQVLQLQGGKINALGRHTVGALLNGARLDNPEYSVSEVVSKFNAAHPGTDKAYEALHIDFVADENCNLN